MFTHSSLWMHQLWEWSIGFLTQYYILLHQRSSTCRWPLTPCLLRSHVWLYPRIIVSKSHGNTSMYVDTVINFAILDLTPTCKNLNQRSLTFDPKSVGVTCVTLPKDHCNQVSRKYIKVCGYSDSFLQKLEPKVIDPLMTFDLTSVKVTCVTLPKDHCVQVPWEYINVCGYSDQFFKKYHILHTYYTHTTYRMSDHIVSFWTQFRRKIHTPPVEN